MKPHFIDKGASINKSFSFEHQSLSHFLKVWHYHPELELIIQRQSTGTRFVGDNISKFEPGEVILLGKNLPHMWLNNEDYFQGNDKLTAEAYVIHFREDFAGKGFFEIPEMLKIKGLFARSAQGINFKGKSKKLVAEQFELLSNSDDFNKILLLINLLKLLADETEYELLSSEGFLRGFERSDKRQLDGVYDFVMHNFTKQIKLDDLADVLNMTASSFSRYFKRVNGKTFSRYVNEIRIGYACHLLLEARYPVTRVCYESGFNNLSNFNRQFKAITKLSPSEYMSRHSLVR